MRPTSKEEPGRVWVGAHGMRRQALVQARGAPARTPRGLLSAAPANRASPTPSTRATVGAMVAFDPDALIGDINNALADQVYYRRGRTTWARSRVMPSQTSTPFRLASATRRQTNASAWAHTLTTQQRDAWRWKAMNRGFTRRRLSRPTLSGWHLFNSVNHVRQMLGLSVLADPPGQDQTDPPYNLQITTLDASTGTIEINFAGASLPNVATMIYASGLSPAGWHPKSGRVRFIGSVAPGTPRPVDISALWASRFGALEGDKAVGIAVAAANQQTGYLSVRAYASAVSTGGPTVNSWKENTQGSGNLNISPANIILLCPFVLPAQLVFSTITYATQTADAAHNYNFGIYNSAGTLVTQTTAGPLGAVGAHQRAVAGAPVTLNAGPYYFAFTADSTVGHVISAANNTALSILTTGVPVQASAAGVLPGTVTVPAVTGGLTFAQQVAFWLS